jgi:hypothetical protein
MHYNFLNKTKSPKGAISLARGLLGALPQTPLTFLSYHKKLRKKRQGCGSRRPTIDLLAKKF